MDIESINRSRLARTGVCAFLSFLIAACAGSAATTEQVPKFRASGAETAAIVDSDLVTESLLKDLGEVGPGQFIPVVVRLKSDADLSELSGLRDEIDKTVRRQIVVEYLQDHAFESQANVLLVAQALEADGLVRNVQPMWLANVICMDLTKDAVNYLGELQDIEYIAGGAKSLLFLEETSWGVRHINSPDVWQRAAGEIHGSGVVVAVIDSGVDLDHPDLASQFWVNSKEDLDGNGKITTADFNEIDEDGNGFVDDVVGWDFETQDNDPSPNLFESERARGHGTHVAGIIAGDGSGGIRTGVAPGARLMPLKINSQRAAWSAMQYALVNGADIVNMSVGWTQSSSPDFATWRDFVDNLTDAGVLVVTGAGNGGQAPMVRSPAPGDITMPGRVPRALTVAAVAEPAATDWLDPIATFSSTGPTSWQTVRGFNDYPYPPGLMKPDLTAPGVAIRSTMVGGSYATKSGSSMAVAHVTGVAALLLEKNPSLLPHELMFQLRETAWRFSEPNDVRGWGRVDALSAVEFKNNQASFDLEIGGHDQQWNVQSIWIDNNNDGVHDEPIPGTTNRIFAEVRNIGGQPAANTELRFYYARAGTAGTALFRNRSNSASEEFRYIGSYFVPVIGPAGSSQEMFRGAVDWQAPMSTDEVGHWTIAVEAVSGIADSRAEADRSNNFSLRNYFNLTLAPGQAATIPFFVYDDPTQKDAQFDLEVIRDSLPPEYDVEFSFGGNDADIPLSQMRGFERVETTEIEGMPSAAFGQSALPAVRMSRNRGSVADVVLDQARPMPATMTIRVPDVDSPIHGRAVTQDQVVTINAANDSGTFGGFTVNVKVDPDAANVSRVIYAQK